MDQEALLELAQKHLIRYALGGSVKREERRPVDDRCSNV
jgi:hypothetical protein